MFQLRRPNGAAFFIYGRDELVRKEDERIRGGGVARQPLKYTGSKWLIADWVISHFPKHRIYCEPFGGGAGVLLQKPPVEVDIYNDLNGEAVNVFRVLRDREKAAELERLLRLTPYSREEFYAAYEPCDDEIERARRYLTRSGQGFGSTGGCRKSPVGWANAHSKPRYAYWRSRYTPEVFAEYVERLQYVQIDNKDALDVIRYHDTEETLFYCDPPYVAETWTESSVIYGEHGAEQLDHAALLELLKSVKGYVVLSGYQSGLYAEMLAGWECATKKHFTAQHHRMCRTECLWFSPKTSEALRRERGQKELFD